MITTICCVYCYKQHVNLSTCKLANLQTCKLAVFIVASNLFTRKLVNMSTCTLAHLSTQFSFLFLLILYIFHTFVTCHNAVVSKQYEQLQV